MAQRPALSKPEDIAKVPLDQPVDVLLSDDPPEPVVEDIKGASPLEPKPEPAPKPEDEINPLQKQLDELKKAETVAARQIEEVRRQNADYERQLRERDQEVTKSREETSQAQYDAILNALGAAQGEIESAKRDYKAAFTEQDPDKMADANERLARASERSSRLEDGKIAFEQRQEADKARVAARQQEKPAQVDHFETSIASLPDNAKTWLREHPEYIREPRKNAKIQALHWDILDEGHKEFSQAYFDSLETRLGLRQADEEADPPPQSARRNTPVSAPPTRDVPSGSNGKRDGGRITLTPQQREAAKIAGVDEVTYAKGLQEVERRKQEGTYA
jgi:hypothetical protein